VSLFASAGVAWVAHDDLKALGLEAGPAFEVGVAVRVMPHVALEATAGYLALARHDSRLRRESNTPDSPLDRIQFDREVTTIPLLAALRVSGAWRSLEAFGRAGAGVAFASSDRAWRSSLEGSSSYSASDATLALHVGAGLSAALTAHVSVGVEATYLGASADFLYPSPQRDTGLTVVPAATRIDTIRIDTFAVAAAIAYRP
jgi:opacity protein-like surface antigen